MDIKKLICQLTLEEKVSLCMGADSWNTKSIERLNIPAVRTSDGPHGLRKQTDTSSSDVGINDSIPATCFPPAALTACSFNRQLIFEMGKAIGEEAILQDIDIVLGPAVNIKRSPLCGRNFEYASEDPYLAGEYAVEFIKGIQSTGVGTSLKHFAVNNQESLRMNINSVVDERALREIYLYAFEKAIKNAKPYTIMASYNRINGDYGAENNHTIRKILREEWGYEGVVLSDWSAINDRVKALKAGCDIEMPYSGTRRSEEIIEAINSGELSQAELDRTVERILELVCKCTKASKVKVEKAYTEHNELAYILASESMVLLKNQDDILPVKKDKVYALIGAFADTPRYQGGGSSHITPTSLTSVKKIFEGENLFFTYSQGYDVNKDEINEDLIKVAVDNAKAADYAILFIGLTDIYENEGLDRKDLSIPPSHIKLLMEVEKVNKNVIVILCAGSAVNTDWDIHCKGMLYAAVMGQAGGRAIYDILFGYVNPSGKLSETFPIKLEDTPCFYNFPGGNNSVYYSESIFVGYRYYIAAKIPVKYAFGYGLSYTSFKYSDLHAEKLQVAEGESINIHVTIKNIGKFNGAEVVEIFIRNTSKNTFNPEIVLKAFQKLYLEKGEEKVITFKIDYEAFTRFDVKDGWLADTAIYDIFAGSSSIDLKEKISVEVTGKGKEQIKYGLDNYIKLKDNKFQTGEFGKLYGATLPSLNTNYKPIDLNTPFKYCSHTIIGKLLNSIAKREITKANSGEENYATRKALIASIDDMPIRSIAVMGGAFGLETAEGIVKMMNGHFVSGLISVIKSSAKKA